MKAKRNPAGSSPAARQPPPPPFAKYGGIDNTRQHSAHLSDTIQNWIVRRIKTIPVLHQMKPAL